MTRQPILAFFLLNLCWFAADSRIMESAQEPQLTRIKVGPDQVTILEDYVVIDARRPMPDWQVREFARIPIYFQEKKYFLRHKEQADKPYAIRYVLESWPADNTEVCRTTLEYNEEAVAERDSAVRGGQLETVVRPVLLFLYPFLGLLWSDTKDKLARFGIISRTVTGLSNFIIFALLLVYGIFAQTLMAGSLKSGKLALGGIIRSFASQDSWNLGVCQISIFWLDCAVFTVLLLDLFIRYSHYARQGEMAEINLGFCEWLKLPFQRKSSQPSLENPGPESAAKV